MVFLKGHIPYNYWQDKKRSKETKKKIREKLKQLYSDPTKHPHYIGRIKRTGYWYLYVPNHPFAGKQNYVAEHRIIMEKSIGRYLKSKEVVHHINGIKTDNRLENLQLFSTHGQHTKIAHPELFERQKIKFKGKHFSPATEFKSR